MYSSKKRPHGYSFSNNKKGRYVINRAPGPSPAVIARMRANYRKASYVPTSARAIEKKGMDTDIDIAYGNVLSTTSTNGSSHILNLIEQGNGSWNRVGRKVKLQSVRIKGLAEFRYVIDPTTGNSQGNLLRMVLVWDKQPSGETQATYDDIFGRTAADGTETGQFLDNLRYDNTGRFSVLKDCLIHGNVLAGGDTGTANLKINTVPFDEFVDLKGRECIYSGQSDPITIADISTGALLLYFRARSNSSNVSEWQINTGVARLRYFD